jgi:hypothetical protein
MLHKDAIVWRQLKHPHVLPFLGLDQSLVSDHDRICMVCPWMENGNLCQFSARRVLLNVAASALACRSFWRMHCVCHQSQLAIQGQSWTRAQTMHMYRDYIRMPQSSMIICAFATFCPRT